MQINPHQTRAPETKSSQPQTSDSTSRSEITNHHGFVSIQVFQGSRVFVPTMPSITSNLTPMFIGLQERLSNQGFQELITQPTSK